MNNIIIFLRYAETQKNSLINATLWGLSASGIKQVRDVTNTLSQYNISKIYTSEELKAIQTVQGLANNNHLKIINSSAFNELKRGGKYLNIEDFRLEKKHQLEDLSYKAFDGESGQKALERFKNGIDNILKDSNN